MLRDFNAAPALRHAARRLRGVEVLCLVLCVALAGCGVKGPLRLPPAPPADATRPAPPTNSVDRPAEPPRQP